jgi:hypothetical protein
LNSFDISLIKPGMFWFENNTFSERMIPKKKIKALVELVDDGVIYGDLTASEIENIEERLLKYDDAKKYIESFSYLCKENERVVLYNDKLLGILNKNYGLVQKKLVELGKNPRSGWQWSSTEYGGNIRVQYFGEESYELFYECGGTYIRPVIALKVS